jgi:hypothetical protein
MNHKWRLILVALFFLQISCKKASNSTQNNAAFVGQWTWINSSEGNLVLLNPDSGVTMTLTFTSNGKLYISHNDSFNTYGNLEVSSPLKLGPNPILDSVSYQLGNESVSCDPVVIYHSLKTTGSSNWIYQYHSIPPVKPLLVQ